VGLAGLCERHFGVNMPKDEQRSDWSRRPLTQRQLSYAAADVLYLIEVAELLAKELRQAKRQRWAQEEFEALTKREWPDREFDEFGYLRIKGARKLDPKGLSILRELYLLRDARAREMDRPPFKVLGNRTLLEIAERKPKKLADLAEIKGITDLLIRRMGAEILAAVAEGNKEPHPPIPKSTGNGRRRMDRRTERRVAALKSWRAERAESLKLDPGVLCPNASLEAIAWKNPTCAEDLEDVPELKRWFVREFAGEVAATIAQCDEAEPNAKDPGTKEPGRKKGSRD
jgi:ribonuclease D